MILLGEGRRVVFANQAVADLAGAPLAGREDFSLIRPARGVLRWSAKPVELEDGGGQLETYTELPAPPWP